MGRHQKQHNPNFLFRHKDGSVPFNRQVLPDAQTQRALADMEYVQNMDDFRELCAKSEQERQERYGY